MFKYVSTIFLLVCASALELELTTNVTKDSCRSYNRGSAERESCCDKNYSGKYEANCNTYPSP